MIIYNIPKYKYVFLKLNKQANKKHPSYTLPKLRSQDMLLSLAYCN